MHYTLYFDVFKKHNSESEVSEKVHVCIEFVSFNEKFRMILGIIKIFTKIFYKN